MENKNQTPPTTPATGLPTSVLEAIGATLPVTTASPTLTGATLPVTTASPTLTGATDMAPMGGCEPSKAPAAEQKPSVGRIVHYFENIRGEVQHRAAIIVEVHNATCVNLTVFDSDGAYRAEPRICQGTTPGCWDWPARV